MVHERHTSSDGVLPLTFDCYGPRQSNLASLLTMMQMNAGTLMPDLSYLGAVAKILDFGSDHDLVAAGAVTRLPLEERAHALKAIERITDFAAGAGLAVAASAGQRTFKTCLEELASERPTPRQLKRACSSVQGLLSVFQDEVGGRKVFAFSHRAGEQLDAGAAFFGEAVEDALPAAALDIAEIGACLAFERWTAAVMHTMRVLEVALATLADRVGVATAANWNRSLNEIEAALRMVTRKDGDGEEQWAAEAVAHLRSVKNAWRNHAMHANTRYDEAQALAVVDGTRSFLRHIAPRLGSKETA